MNSSLLCIGLYKSDMFTVTYCRDSELILEKTTENTPETHTFLIDGQGLFVPCQYQYL